LRSLSDIYEQLPYTSLRRPICFWKEAHPLRRSFDFLDSAVPDESFSQRVGLLRHPHFGSRYGRAARQELQVGFVNFHFWIKLSE
jgi:hypothetical protein